MSFEIGIMTFGEVTKDPRTGRLPSPRERVLQTIEQAQLADQVGLDVFGIGEHHRSDFVGSAPTILLAAAAQATRNIRLTSSVTVLSSEDPVRVWEQFATIDLLSAGRAEIIAGRGSYTESFPLFGYDLADYADLFREKLDLLLKIRERNPLSWSGRFRAPLVDADIAPRAENVNSSQDHCDGLIQDRGARLSCAGREFVPDARPERCREIVHLDARHERGIDVLVRGSWNIARHVSRSASFHSWRSVTSRHLRRLVTPL